LDKLREFLELKPSETIEYVSPICRLIIIKHDSEGNYSFYEKYYGKLFLTHRRLIYATLMEEGKWIFKKPTSELNQKLLDIPFDHIYSFRMGDEELPKKYQKCTVTIIVKWRFKRLYSSIVTEGYISGGPTDIFFRYLDVIENNVRYSAITSAITTLNKLNELYEEYRKVKKDYTEKGGRYIV